MTQAQRMTQAERTDLSDSRMLAAATQLIVERGTANTTLKDVGSLAGYSRGLAGYRFGNKAGLFEFVVRSIGEDWLRELKDVSAGKTGYEAICAAVDAHYRFCAEAPVQVAAFYLLWFESIGPQSEVKTVISSIHQRRHRDVRAWVHAGIDKGTISATVDADDIAGQFSAAIVGIVYQWLLDPEDMQTIQRLYKQLKHTMRLCLGAANPQELAE